MNKKVFTFDMDGTILNSKGQILPATVKALEAAKEKGHINVLCSGRPFFDMIDVAKEAKVFSYLICNNGSYFYDLSTQKFFIKKQVPKDVVKSILKIGFDFSTLFALHTDNGVYRAKLFSTDPMWAAAEIKAEWHRFELVDMDLIPEIVDREKVTQVSLRATKEMVAELLDICKPLEDKADIHIAGEVYLDINPKDTSKLTGIEDLSKHINMNVKDFIAFGDSGNDLQMLAGAGYGIAMANGTEAAKKAANEVIGNNDTDAIAQKVLELI